MSERKSKNLSRRHFLGMSVGAVVTAGIGCGSESDTPAGTGGQTGTGGAGTGGGTGSGATGAGATGAGTGGAGGTGGGGGTGLGVVTLVRADDWKQAVKDACVARMPDLAGKTVVIRPNVIQDRADGTTSPEVIAGVVAAAKQKGASEILICEDAFADADCVRSMQTLGITSAVGSDATPTNLQGTSAPNSEPSGATTWTGGIDFYDIVKNADYVVNVPKCKTHGTCGFSLALKAWLGSLKRPGSLHSGNLNNKCAEAHLVRQEDLVVIDATRCMTTGGPTEGGSMADSKVVVVSEDAIAADVTGVAILRANGASLIVPWQHPQITRAMALNFPGWLNAQTDFSYSLAGISQADADAIMAKRNA